MASETKQPLGPNQERWVQALESGEYKQGRIFLRSDSDAFCCLGVACVIANVEGEEADGYWVFGHDGCSGLAPDEVVQHLALHGSYGEAVPSDGDADLSAMNDKTKSFSEIAAIIRSDPSVYFMEPR